MDEKKNFTPNAIEDDNLEDVAGGGFGLPNRKMDPETLQQMLNSANNSFNNVVKNPISSSSDSKHSH